MSNLLIIMSSPKCLGLMYTLRYSPCQAHTPTDAAWQVEQLNEQLKTLEAEQAELAKYQAADKERRSLEYTIYDKEIAQTRDKLEQVAIIACCVTGHDWLAHEIGTAACTCGLTGPHACSLL